MPNIGQNDVIFPGRFKLLFNLEQTGTNTKCTIVSNIETSVVQNLWITLSGNEIQSINEYNVLALYRELWLPKFKRENNFLHEQISRNDGTIRELQVKVSDHASTDEEKAIVAINGNTLCIPLRKMFELTSDLPFYHRGLHVRL